MFQAIRHRLLFSYLTVLTVILAIFAIAVRTTFAYSLKVELSNRLAVLAEAASGTLDLEGEELAVDKQDLLLNPNQAVQWFDLQGHLLDQQGNHPLILPFDSKQTFQTQTLPFPAQSFTLPAREEERNNRLIGYVRVSESLEAMEGTLHRLDWGLGGGVIMALALSGLGGIWLTRQAMQPIEQSFQRLQRFTADASHELRSPLMAVKSNAAVALKYAEGMRAADAEKFQAIASATTQMTALTEELLMLARTDRTPPLKRSLMDLKTILEQLIQLYKPLAAEKQITLNLQLAHSLNIYGDRVEITRLFTNLIDNALRYTPDKGTIDLSGNCEGQTVVVSIRDTGMGISPDQIEHLFERFWKADRSRRSEGFGLGLAIAQTIARKHNGSLTVTSQLGTGSCFTVQLPTISGD